ncbi:MAG TPA: hypothetical protein VEK33_21560 [Terriglobales bacterium]|nr:hypothetical protein [Terriglobales bacterium]
MNKERKPSQTGPDLEFEYRDLRPRAVYAFLIGLAVMSILVFFVVWGFYDVIDAYQRRHQPPQNPLVTPETDTRRVLPEVIDKFPQPRLERNERLEINDFRLREEQSLYSYGWVDQQAGIVRIPIDRAMELIAQRGLSTTPKVGTNPPSEVNVVNQAARRSDVSNLPATGQPPAEEVKKP